MKHQFGYLHQIVARTRGRFTGNGVLPKKLITDCLEFRHRLDNPEQADPLKPEIFSFKSR